MGTASTMACILVGLGMMLPFQSATAPAVSSARLRVAEATGANAVQMAKNQLRPQSILSRESFLNAITVLQAIGGSTNAVVHLMAILGRHPAVAGTITLDTVDEIGRKTSPLVDLKPSGDNYMTDFHNSRAACWPCCTQLKPLLHLGAMTVTGRTLGEELAAAPFRPIPRDAPANCIHPFDAPLYPASSLVVLRGNLAPGGAVMKASASKDRRLLRHTGRAVVFAGSADLTRRIDDPDLDVDENSVLVLQNIGPIGNPRHARGGHDPDPAEAGGPRGGGHAAHLGRPHERDGGWHHRPATCHPKQRTRTPCLGSYGTGTLWCAMRRSACCGWKSATRRYRPG